MLKKQDIVILAKLLGSGDADMPYAELGKRLFISPSEVHASCRRLMDSRLLSLTRTPIREAVLEFLIHGFKYVFPPEYRPRLIRGIPTSYAAPVARGVFTDDAGPLPVWPSSTGSTRGQGVEPLYPSVVKFIEQDAKLYALLALLDMIRMGKAREVKWAEQKLREALRP